VNFVFAELAQAEGGVGAERVQPGEEPGVAALFAMAELGAESTAGFLQVATIDDGLVDVTSQLFIEIAIEVVAAERVRYAREEGHR
jgi:hypothetical protein